MKTIIAGSRTITEEIHVIEAIKLAKLQGIVVTEVVRRKTSSKVRYSIKSI